MGVEHILKINHIGNELFQDQEIYLQGEEQCSFCSHPFGPKETVLWAKQEEVWFLPFNAGVLEHSDSRLPPAPHHLHHDLCQYPQR